MCRKRPCSTTPTIFRMDAARASGSWISPLAQQFDEIGGGRPRPQADDHAVLDKIQALPGSHLLRVVGGIHRRHGLIVYFHNDLSNCLTHFNGEVSLQSSLEGEPFSAKQRFELSRLRKLRSFTQNVSMVKSSSAGQYWQQGENPRVGSSAK
jgi:hypothetical protein